MPRHARLVIPGELFHITQRGNYGQDIFSHNNDKVQYLKYFEEYRSQYGLDVFAFCLMNNHVHFIVRPRTETSMAETIGRAHQKYSRYYHARWERRGHLWQQRYFSGLLEGNHIAGAIRYVERNPVRAGIVRFAWEYNFSSARAHLGTRYRLITLADVTEYIETEGWRDFLTEE